MSFFTSSRSHHFISIRHTRQLSLRNHVSSILISSIHPFHYDNNNTSTSNERIANKDYVMAVRIQKTELSEKQRKTYKMKCWNIIFFHLHIFHFHLRIFFSLSTRFSILCFSILVYIISFPSITNQIITDYSIYLYLYSYSLLPP